MESRIRRSIGAGRGRTLTGPSMLDGGMTRTRRMRLLVAMVASLRTAIAITFSGRVADLYDSGGLGNDPTDTPCEELPPITRIETALESNSDLVKRITAVDPAVWVIASSPCADFPASGEVAIYYPSGQVRKEIEAVLEGDSFGVPTSLYNV